MPSHTTMKVRERVQQTRKQHSQVQKKLAQLKKQKVQQQKQHQKQRSKLQRTHKKQRIVLDKEAKKQRNTLRRLRKQLRKTMKGGAKTQYTVIKEKSGCYTVKPEGQTDKTGISSRGLRGRVMNGLGAAASAGQKALKGRKSSSTQPVLPPPKGTGSETPAPKTTTGAVEGAGVSTPGGENE